MIEKNYLDQAMEFVKAQASVRPMTPAEMFEMRDEVAARLKKDAEGVSDAPSQEGCALVADLKTAIRERSITCCVCGEKMSLITAKHLAKHGLTPESYKEMCGYKKTQPLSCKSLSKMRKESMKKMALWERRKGKTVDAKPSKKEKAPKTEATA